MELHQFKQFRAIAECGTMRAAAEKLYLSQPTLSQNLKKLESELGFKLFNCIHNTLHLTPAGEVVLTYSNLIDENLQDMHDALEEIKRVEESTLHIGCFSSMFSVFEMPRFASEMPHLFFDTVNSEANDLIAGLENERFDIVFATDLVRDPQFSWLKLYREQAYLSVPKESDMAQKDHVTREDFAGLPVAIEDNAPGYSDWYDYVLKQLGVVEKQIDYRPFTEHVRTKDTRPEANLITSFIMKYVQVSDARVVLPIDEPVAHRDIGLMYRKDASAKTMEFVKYVKTNRAALFSGNTFISYFLSPEGHSNLRIVTE